MYLKHVAGEKGERRTLEITSITTIPVYGEDFDKWSKDGRFQSLFTKTGAQYWEMPLGKVDETMQYVACAVTRQAQTGTVHDCAVVMLLPAGTSYLLNGDGKTIDRI